MGFPALRSYYDIVPGEALVLGSELNGLNLEVCVFDSMVGGRLSCRLRSVCGVLHRVTLATAAIDAIPRLLDGTPIRTISPLGLFQIRAASHHLRAFGELRPTDAAPQRLLRDRFLSDQNESDLLPDIEALVG